LYNALPNFRKPTVLLSPRTRRGKAGKIAKTFRSKYQSKIHRIKEKLTQNLKKMENNIDFKNLWKQQAVSPPNIEELLAKLKHFKKN
jgi:tRNA U34 5-carboxymethylaminomethyl modifying GTPase MnmE/TrmE